MNIMPAEQWGCRGHTGSRHKGVKYALLEMMQEITDFKVAKVS